MQRHLAAAVAAALLSLAGSPAVASSATAQLSDLHIALVDLDPGDGIAPSVTFQNLLGGSFVAAETGTSTLHLAYPANGGAPFGSASSASAYGGATASAFLAGDPFAGGADARAASATGGAGFYGASTVQLGDGAIYMPFTLSAETRLVITADASVSAMSTLPGAQVDTWASVFLKLADFTGQGDVSTDSLEVEQFGLSGAAPSASTEARRIEISFDNLAAASADGLFFGSVDTYAADLPAVPEPSGTAAMMAGLGLLAWRARRRAR